MEETTETGTADGPAEQTGAERREQTRYDVAVAADVLTERREVLHAQTRNLSRGGVALVCDRPIERDASVLLNLYLLVDGIEDALTEPVRVRGRVAWAVRAPGGRHSCGVRFEQIGPAEQARIDRFLASLRGV